MAEIDVFSVEARPMAGTEWLARAEQEAWLERHMLLVEEYGCAAAGVHAWTMAADDEPHKALVLRKEKERMEKARLAIEESARRWFDQPTR